MHPADEKIRVVIDVNLWISYLLTPQFRPRCQLLFGHPYELLMSEAFYREFDDTIIKPELQRRLPSGEASILRCKLQQCGTIIKVNTRVCVCRDLNDNYLLALSLDGCADYLITRDRDLLVIKKFGKTKIVSFFEFEQLIYDN